MQVAQKIDGLAIQANCGSEMDIRKVIVRVEFEHGPIDVFVANAGIPANGGPEVTDDEWKRIWQVNCMQHVYVARHLFPRWIAQDQPGCLVVTASAAGLLTQVGSLPYSVTKHAAVAIAEWLAITYAEHGIRVACLCPQAVRSGMTPEDIEGGVAGGDGMLEPEQVAKDVCDALDKNQFLVLPHAEVLKYMQRKTNDYDRWLKGMQRMHETFGKMMLNAPNMSAAKL